MSNKTDRQILTELLNSLMDEEIVFVRERLMAIVDYSLHDEKLVREGMVNSGVSADLYINTLKRIKTIIKYEETTPTPIVDPTMQLVVETGMPLRAATRTVMAAPISMQKPRAGE